MKPSFWDLGYMFRYNPDKNEVRVFNQMGIEISANEAIAIARGLVNFYGSLDAEHQTELNRERAEQELFVRANLYGSIIQKKKFRRNKQPWVFYCAVCSRKVSSEEQDTWYMTGGPSELLSHVPYQKCCSESCAEVIEKEVMHEARIKVYKEYGLDIKEG